jgi:hypothetical protein
LEEAFDLSIEGIATDDLFVCFDKRIVFRVDCVDCNLAARGIPFPENLKKILLIFTISVLDFGWQIGFFVKLRSSGASSVRRPTR